MENPIKLLIADDSKLTVLALKTVFKNQNEIQILDIVENGQQAFEMTKKLKPDVILMDIGMPVMDGIQATKQIKKLELSTKIIILTSHNSEQDVRDALSAGANSYCMKDIEPETLINVIKSTHNGASWLDPIIAKIVLSSFINLTSETKSDNHVSKTELTDREIEVLSLISKGCTNLAISETLFISMNTVKTHIKNIFQKLEVEDRTQAAMKGMEKDII